MSEELPDDWSWKPLGEFAEVVSGGTPSKNEPSYWDGGTIPWATPSDITKTSGRVIFDTEEKITDLGLSASAASRLPAGSILMTSRATLGEARIAAVPTATNQGFKSLVPKAHIDNWYLFYQIQNSKSRYSVFGKGTTFLEVNTKDTLRLPIPYCPKNEQRRIATILTTLDEEIEATEALIAKHQQIKAGLMHDLFTRGLWTQAELARGDHKGLPCEATAQPGHLRPTPEEAPGLYQDSPLGLIPREWKLSSIGEVAESVADGPFGSNLKTEHYVVEPGVRVVRLQNIQDTIYNDEDRAFVSESHANYLIRNQVVSGDILVAGLGEDKHVVARACCYPDGLPPAINKADCFRLRCNSEMALNPFVMFYLNTSIARGQVRRFEQGVTRRRINGGNLKRVLFGLPSLQEQKRAVAMLDSAGADIDAITEQVAKLRQQKQGLMHDLLTGRVRVDNC